jgi:hypothetical protein
MAANANDSFLTTQKSVLIECCYKRTILTQKKQPHTDLYVDTVKKAADIVLKIYRKFSNEL